MASQLSKWKINSLAIALCIGLISCKNENQQPVLDVPQDVNYVVERPEFSSDSAFFFVNRQVEFGPRIPGTEAHEICAEWLANALENYGAKVITQQTQVVTAEGKTVPCYNIIGSYKPELDKRILLAAHWDTRPWADQDSNSPNEPIDGANDGASGVGVLLEIARQIQLYGTEVGVDIIFFDVEDSGLSEVENSYCLGSQYWSKNLHVPNYYAYKAILLDMVGAEGATFTMEGGSMQINPELVNEIWDIAHKLGHQQYFVYKRTAPIIDDHYYVYRNARIPMIDIIHHDPTTMTGFGKYWHTHDDNMGSISKATLQAVGETVLATIRKK